jgi:mono/diheme cytochrome c family protein
MEQALTRGHERYDIYCAPCHGLAGDGAGLVSTRARQIGASALIAPTLHDARIREMPDGQLFGTISNGIRNMPAYAHSIPIDDRWAIVTYVRALQISQASRPTALNTEVAQ